MKMKLETDTPKKIFPKFSIFSSKESMETEQKANNQKAHLKLIKSLQAGDIPRIELYVSKLFVNDLTPCSLVAAIYSLRLDVIKYVENKLEGKLLEEWGKHNIEALIDGLSFQKPGLLPKNAVLCDLGAWYYKHRNAIWCAQYDAELLEITGCENWSTGMSAWEQRILLDIASIIPNRRCTTIVDSNNKNCLSIPPLFAHQKAVKIIEKNICEVIEYLQQIKGQLSDMAKQCGPECNIFQSGNKSCILNQEIQDIEEMSICRIKL